MKKIYLAVVLAIVCTVASGEEVSCDLVGDRDIFRFIRENEKAILIFNPNSADLLSVPMWCGGNTCVSLEDENEDSFDAGKLIIHGPVLKYDPATENVGGPTYSIWHYDEMTSIEGMEVTCVD